jgi:hypothetical protein
MHKVTRNRANLAAFLRELADHGSPVDLSVADLGDREVELEIRQVGGFHDSGIFELANGLTGFILDLAVTNQAHKTMYSIDVELSLGWKDDLFQWLPDPREEGDSEIYRFPGRYAPEFPRDEVRNHLLLNDGALPSLRPVRGWLLATGGPLPKNVHHGQWVEATLSLTASDHSEHTANMWLWTERLEIKRASMGKADLFESGKHPGTGLYGQSGNAPQRTAISVAARQKQGKLDAKCEPFNFERFETHKSRKDSEGPAS